MKAKSIILTKEERGVLILSAPYLSGGHRNNIEIGRRLGISANRVKTLIHQICIKLGANNRNEAIVLAVKQGEIKLNELYTIDELADLFRALQPDMLRRITHLVCEGLDREQLLRNDEHAINTKRRRNTLLTKCERDVLALAGRGHTNREIADTLYVSMGAVRTFLHRACTKLGAHKRADAAVLALKGGEISIGEIFSPDELISPLVILDTEAIDKIAQLMAQKRGRDPVPISS